MPNNSESQCYFVQLQIDSFLDGELGIMQREDFVSHVRSCGSCAREFQYAQTVQDTLLDLPLLDCDEQVLEPIHRLANGGSTAASIGPSFWNQLGELISTAPALLRYGVPVALATVVAVAISSSVLSPELANGPGDLLVADQATLAPVEQYSPQEVRQALVELNLAIDYLNQISERTEGMISDRFVVTPLQDSLNASFDRARERNGPLIQNDPI